MMEQKQVRVGIEWMKELEVKELPKNCVVAFLVYCYGMMLE